jgi:hypothetical protein
VNVRESVIEFVKLGPLPDSSASAEKIALHQVRLARIKPPVTDEEAELLAKCFGPDDCFGLAWTLLHLVESAPGRIPIKSRPSPQDNEWLRLLWDRSHRTG